MKRRRIGLLLLMLLLLFSCDWLNPKPKKAKFRGMVDITACSFLRPMNDTLLFVGGRYNDRFGIVNVADPDAPVWVVRNDASITPWDAVFKDGIGYVAMNGLIRSLDFADAPGYRVLDEVPFINAALCLDGNILYAAGPDSFCIIDVTNPAGMVVLGRAAHLGDTATTQNYFNCLAARNGRLFIAWSNFTEQQIPILSLYDVRNPTAPTLLDAFTQVDTKWRRLTGAVFADDYIVYGNDYGLTSLRYDASHGMVKVDSIDIFDQWYGGREPGSTYFAGVLGLGLTGNYAVCRCNNLPNAAVVNVGNPGDMKLFFPTGDDLEVSNLVDAITAHGKFFYVATWHGYVMVYELP